MVLAKIYIYIKNHDFCTISIIQILSFLLGINISHINNEKRKTNVHLKIADILNRAYPGGRRPPLPRAGGNQSCLTTDIGFHSECSNMIPVRSKRSVIRERVVVQHDGTWRLHI